MVGFDFPGCGKSDGLLLFPDNQSIKLVTSWVIENIHPEHIILWSRGTASVSTFAYLSEEKIVDRCLYPSVIFDSPFTNFNSVVQSFIHRCTFESQYVPGFMYKLLGDLVKNKIKNVLKINIHSIETLSYLEDVIIPCMIMSAENDDYIPVTHGLDIVTALPSADGNYMTFPGGHFGLRPRLVVMGSYNFISKNILKYRIDNVNNSNYPNSKAVVTSPDKTEKSNKNSCSLSNKRSFRRVPSISSLLGCKLPTNVFKKNNSSHDDQNM